MEIRRLFTTTNETPPPERFLAIQIQEAQVKSALWQVVNNQPEVVAVGSTEMWTDGPSLVMGADASLSAAFSAAGVESDRVVFGLPESWIKDDKIDPHQSSLLKAILEQLELKAIGFVGTTEAILQYLRIREGIPPSVILVDLGQTKINVVVTKLGETIGRQEVGRSVDVGADVEEALSRMELDQLPSRILVTDSRDLEVVQQLTSYPWQEKLPFLHLPKVEALDTTFSIMAVAIAGGSEAARSVGVETAPVSATNPQNPVEVLHQEPVVPQDDLGFVSDADIQDIEQVDTSEMITPTGALPQEPEVVPPAIHTPKLPKVNFRVPQLPSLPKLPAFKVPQIKLPGKGILIVIPIVLLLLAAGSIFASYSLLTKATVTVSVSNKGVDKSVIAMVGGAGDGSMPQLNATSETQDIEKTQTVDTTGEATVGDKATGEVTLFNKTDVVRTVPKGTALATGNGLRFTLDADTTLASRSAQETSDGVNIVYGQTKATVTAAKIGAEYNLAANGSLSVADYPKSSLEAKVSSGLSGGSSRTVRAVAQADRDNVVRQVTQAIKDDAQSRFATPGSSDKTIVIQDVKVNSQSFNKGVGEETDQLTLTMSGQVTILHVSADALRSFISDQIKNDIPAGFDVDIANSTVDVQSPQSNGGKVTATIPIHAKLIPQISIDAYRKQLAGKTVDAAQTLVQSLPGYQHVTFVISPKIPLFSNRLPTNPSRINLTLQSVQ